MRVTGARWLASRGVALLTIQVLARWSSDVVLRYVAETPLQSLTAEFKRAAMSFNLGSMQSARGPQLEDVSRRLNLSESQVVDLREELSLLRAEVESVRRGAEENASVVYIMNCASEKIHIPMAPGLEELPPACRRARCGWQFGFCTYQKIKKLPESPLRCGRCFPTLSDSLTDSE